MPSSAFERLPMEKKNKIIEAAFCEFEEFGIEDSSIYSISKRAGISRTAFYYYFTGVKDIFSMLVNLIMQDFLTSIGCSKENKVDIFECYYYFFVYITNYKGSKREGFIRRLFGEMRPKLQENITEPYINFFKENLVYIKNLEKLDTEDPQEDIKDLTFVLFSVLTSFINYYFNNEVSFEKVDKKYKRGIKVIKYGVIKNEYREGENGNE